MTSTTALQSRPENAALTARGFDGRIHAGTVLGAAVPGLAILMIAAALLVTIA